MRTYSFGLNFSPRKELLRKHAVLPYEGTLFQQRYVLRRFLPSLKLNPQASAGIIQGRIMETHLSKLIQILLIFSQFTRYLFLLLLFVVFSDCSSHTSYKQHDNQRFQYPIHIVIICHYCHCHRYNCNCKKNGSFSTGIIHMYCFRGVIEQLTLRLYQCKICDGSSHLFCSEEMRSNLYQVPLFGSRKLQGFM